MLIEEWRPIPEYEGLYEISNYGRVRSLDRIIKIKNGSIRLIKGKYLKPDIFSRYAQVTVCKNGKEKRFKIHRLVLYTFVSIELNKEVNHIDGNKLNNKLSNLEWVTRQENTVHAYKNNLINSACGERAGHAKLTEKQAKEILKLSKIKNQRELAKMFNIHFGTVNDLVLRKTWKYL